MCEIDPVVALDESLDHPAGMNGGVVENQHPKGVRQARVKRVEKCHEPLGGAPRRSLPIKPLGAKIERAKDGGPLSLDGLGHSGVLPLAKPTAVHLGLMGQGGFIDQEPLKRAMQLAFVDRFDHVCHPGFFLSELGACVGRVGVKRL
jgi:hypothetical protein